MSDAPQTMSIDEVRTLKVGEIVVVNVECTGDDSDDVERAHPAGTEARVLGMRILPAPQGLTVTLEVGEAEDERIVSVFDESDECGFAFTRAHDADGLTVEPDMDSAGAELMALTFRMEKHPEFEGDVSRIREIAGWASVGRMSDFEKASIRIMGGMMGAMHRRNFAFAEDLPISTQFEAFLDSIPEPLPGDVGHVDQATIDPVERRDVYDAVVEMREVRTWTAHDGVPRALALAAGVTPDGVPGTADVFAEGEAAALLVSDSSAVLRLRAVGRSIRAIGPGDMQRAVPAAPAGHVSRAALALLQPVPFDPETSAVVAKGLDLLLADDDLTSRYETRAIDAAKAVRDALDAVAR